MAGDSARPSGHRCSFTFYTTIDIDQSSIVACAGRRGAGLCDPNLRKLHGKSQIRGRTHLRPAEAPSAQIGRGSALETDTPERTGQTASQNVVVLKNKMGHQVDADGKLRRGTWQVDGAQLFSGCNGAAASAHG